MALPNVGEECSRNSPLPTIQESEESNDDLNELENVLKLSRKKREHRTPSKKKPDSDVVPSSSNVRQRTPRHCASRAREKITTLLNPKDTSGGEYYAASDYGSDGSEEAYHPTIDEDIMPKGEYGAAIDDDDDENMMSKGSEIFGFKTPSRRRSALMRTTPLKTPTSVSKQRLNRTPNKTPLKTKEKISAIQTPQTVRRKLRNKIVKVTTQVLECVSDPDSNESDSDSESSEEEEEEELALDKENKVNVNPSMDVSVKTEDYFLAQSSSVHTSNRTLNRLKTPRLSQEAIDSLMEDVNDPHSKEKLLLMQEYHKQFTLWSFLISEGFNILVYGLGSKRYLIDDFRTEKLNQENVIVVNGYFPGLTMKEILNSITAGVLEDSSTFSGTIEQLEYIEQQFTASDNRVFIIVHNIDGPSLQFSREQETLARLASIEGIHIIASSDHINTPLLWDQRKLSQSKFVYFDCTTFAPYTEEISYENSLLVHQSSTLGLASLVHVFASLTYNAKAIYVLIAKRQLEHKEESNYHGFAFHELYNECRDNMLVNSDLTLRAQLTEFKDHKLLRMRRTPDGTEAVHIPLDNTLLEEFVLKYEDGM